jgi:hypothetical protein
MRLRFSRLLAAALFCCFPAYGLADAPVISDIVPYGLSRTVPTEVTFTGKALDGNPRLVCPIPLLVEAPATPVSEPGKWVIKLTAPAATPIGVYPLRVLTDNGISNPFLLAVGQLPNAPEAEPNNTHESAQVVPVPCVVEGQLAGNDVDYFKFTGRKGQRVLIDAQCARIGSGVDPQIRLTTATRVFLASADDTPGLFTDARMVVELPEDGEYVVELSDTKYQGAGRAVYRLLLGAVPAAEEVYPLGGRRDEAIGLELRGGSLSADTADIGAAWVRASAGDDSFRPRLTNHMLGQAGPTDPTFDFELPLPLEISNYNELREPLGASAAPPRGVAPVVFNGRIEAPGDEDRFLLVATPGQVLRIAVHAADLGSALDASIRVLNPANNQQIGAADDTTVPPTGLRGQPRKAPGSTSPDPSMEVTVPGGVNEIAVVIRDLAGRGGLGYGYRIVVEPADPVVYLQFANDSQASIPKGGTLVIPVSVVRQGFNGPFKLDVVNPPPGLVVRPGQVADRSAVGTLSVTALPDANFGAVVLDVVGTSEGPNGNLMERVGRLVVFAKQQELASYAIEQTGLAVAPAPAPVLTLETASEPIEAVHGFPAVVPIKVIRSSDPAKGELTIPVVQPLPPGLTMGETKIAADAAEGNVTVNVDPATSVGPVTLGFTGKGKFQDKDQQFGIPAVTLNVVRPAGVEVDQTKLEIKPGQTLELKGKVVRRGGFKEPLSVQLNGLPEGLKCDPVSVAPEAMEFSLSLVADAGAKPAEAKVQLALAAFKLAGKDYNTPTLGMDLKIVP